MIIGTDYGRYEYQPYRSEYGIGEETCWRWLRTGKCSYLPEERDGCFRPDELGLVDTFAVQILHKQQIVSVV